MDNDELIDAPLEAPVDASDASADQKAKNRDGYEQRQLTKRLEDAQRELEGYKRRDEEARKATLTETQKLKEELETLRAERERDNAQRLRERVTKEFRLPDAFSNRLIGSDEESLRADAEELAKLLPRTRVGVTSDPIKESAAPSRTYKESQLSDRAFYKAHEADIMQAYREGRIVRGE